MKTFAFSLFVALQIMAIPAFAQSPAPNADALVDQGDVLYKNKGSRTDALEKYKAAIKIQPENLRANYMAGLCYLQTSQKSYALTYFLKAHDLEPDFVAEVKTGPDMFPDLRFLIARTYQVGANYTKAAEFYQLFKESVAQGNASRYSMANKGAALRASERRVFECQVATELAKKPVDSRIAGIPAINSPYPDYGPVISPDGQTLYFTSRRPGGAGSQIDDDSHFFEDIYAATRDGAGRWGQVRMIKELSTPGHESVSCLSGDGKTMIISRGEGNGDLYSSSLNENGIWSEPVSLGKNINTSGHETAAFLSRDGSKLFFVSDRPGGFGGSDLYVSERRSNGKWGSAANLGPKVNTIYDEDSPAADSSGNKLYFASKGHQSVGGFDIMASAWEPANESFGLPENLGFPLNSADDDNTYSMSPAESGAYFSSYRENGQGDLDIYMHYRGEELPEAVKKDQAEFIAIANNNQPLMEDRVNTLSHDSTSVHAPVAGQEAEKTAQAGTLAGPALSIETPAMARTENTTTQAEKPVRIPVPVRQPATPVLAATMESPKPLQAAAGNQEETGKEKEVKPGTNPTANAPGKKNQPKESLVAVAAAARVPATPLVTPSADAGMGPSVVAAKENETPAAAAAVNKEGETYGVRSQAGAVRRASSRESSMESRLSVQILEEERGAAAVAAGKGFYMYDPIRDMEEVAAGRNETAIRVLILDTDNRTPLDGKVVFIDQESQEVLVPQRVRNGVYEVTLKNASAKNFMVSVEKEGFHFKNILIQVPPASQEQPSYVTRNIELKRHTLNKPRILRNVYFDFDKTELSGQSTYELEMLYFMLTQNPKMVIEVNGHADLLGDDTYNEELSQKRALKVVDYLTHRGIDPARLRALGYGERKPISGTDDSETGRALNRRTEFMIIAN
jgi:outer membrane protein OmpA-like peptidoglycan-associated protein